MARSALLTALRRALRLAACLDSPDPAARHLAARSLAGDHSPRAGAAPLPRRSLLLGTAAGLAACAPAGRSPARPTSPSAWPPASASAPAATASAAPGRGRPRVLVIGAGLAGLRCAHRLLAAPVDLVLCESRSTPGGRVVTERGTFAPLHAELGGEFIDSAHVHLRRLCDELGLPLDDRTPDGAPALADRFFFGGRAVSERELVAALGPAARAMTSELSALGPLEHLHRHRRLREREAQLPSLADWLRAHHVEGLARAALQTAFVTELGRELDELAWLPMLQMFALDEARQRVQLYGESDERFVVRGGNGQITARLAAALGERLRPGHSLRRLTRDPDGRLRATLDHDATSRDEVADVVVLALPFSVLRASRGLVTLAPSLAIPAPQQRAIDELAYGTNAKLIVGTKQRDWPGPTLSGSIFSDLPFQSTWDSGRTQPGPGGLLTSFRGGHSGASLRPAQAAEELTRLLADLRRAAPSPHLDPSGPVLVADWPSPERGVFGSYSTYGPGQPGLFGGLEGQPAGNLLFAGEHTSVTAQGYMEGAVESGERAAAEALRLLAPGG